MSLISISHSVGCGGPDIAGQVAGKLGVDLYDDNRLQEEGVKMGAHSKYLKELDEKAPGFFDRFLSNKPEAYLDFMESVVYHVAQHGQGVILGHGSQFLLQDFGCALHVLIFAEKSERIQFLIDHHGLSFDAAKKIVKKSDHERRGFFRYAFHKEWNDPSLYDLTINTGKLSPNSTTNLIVETAKSEVIQSCSQEALDRMQRLSVSKKIRATLIENQINLSMINIEVTNNGLVDVSGMVNTITEKKQILDIVNGISEISDVQSELVVKPAGI